MKNLGEWRFFVDIVIIKQTKTLNHAPTNQTYPTFYVSVASAESSGAK